MIDTIPADELSTLLEMRAAPSVSIYMPVYRSGVEIQQNPIRLKNLLRQAEERLAATGMRPAEAREMLKPAHDLVGDVLFWQEQGGGLALFVAPGTIRTYKLPIAVEELVIVNDRFHVKPMLRPLVGESRYYVLAFSQNRVRFFRGSRYQIGEVSLEGMPLNLMEALHPEDLGDQIQSHPLPQRAGVPGERMAMFYGTGGIEADQKVDLLRYCQMINDVVAKHLADAREPLVLAAVEFLMPIYKEANTYQHVMPEGITGNPDELSAEELQKRAWKLVQPYFAQEMQNDIERYENLVRTPRTSRDLKEVVPAAYYGRVDTLFVSTGYQEMGRFDPATGVIHLHPQPPAEHTDMDDDLLDAVAQQTILHRGRVYTLAPEEMPGGVPIAALFRY